MNPSYRSATVLKRRFSVVDKPFFRWLVLHALFLLFGQLPVGQSNPGLVGGRSGIRHLGRVEEWTGRGVVLYDWKEKNAQGEVVGGRESEMDREDMRGREGICRVTDR
jgi:hypothetical protein